MATHVRGTRGIWQWLRRLVLVSLGLTVLAMGLSLQHVAVSLRYASNETVEQYEWEFTETATNNLGKAETIANLASSVLLMFWMFRALNNLNALGVRGVRHAPFWAFAGYLIPVVNLVIPYQILSDIWHAHDPGIEGNSARWTKRPQLRLLLLWWLSTIVIRIAVTAYMQYAAATPNEYFVQALILVGLNLLSCANSILLLILLQQFQERMDAFYARVATEAERAAADAAAARGAD